MDRAKFDTTAPPREEPGVEDHRDKKRKNFGRKGKTPGGRSGHGKVKSGKRSTAHRRA